MEFMMATKKRRRAWPTASVTRGAVPDYIECFYDTRRRHSTLDYLSPLEYELLAAQGRLAA